jgi:calcium-dependent protein kinase
VRLARLNTNPDKIFAIKTIHKEKLKKDIILIERELQILREMDHPNIVKFYEVYQDEKFFHIVMEVNIILTRFLSRC